MCVFSGLRLSVSGCMDTWMCLALRPLSAAVNVCLSLGVIMSVHFSVSLFRPVLFCLFLCLPVFLSFCRLFSFSVSFVLHLRRTLPHLELRPIYLDLFLIVLSPFLRVRQSIKVEAFSIVSSQSYRPFGLLTSLATNFSKSSTSRFR